MQDSYLSLLDRKLARPLDAGIADPPQLNPALFPFQRDVLRYLLRIGRGAAFLDTGLGKTLIQLDWARVVTERTGGAALILTPLAVGAQTVREAEKFGIDARLVRNQQDCAPGINITNYEKLDNFDAGVFAAVVLDESSILKSWTGKTRNDLIARFSRTPFRLACTATPAPNDHMELGNHAELLGASTMNEMLARFFVNDTADTGQWRLKGHARRTFWEWVATWACCVGRPSDLGYSDKGFALPPLRVVRHVVDHGIEAPVGALFAEADLSATGVHGVKRATADRRAVKVAEIVAAEPAESWIVWCDSDYEADALTARIPGAVEVRGSHDASLKERRLLGFADGSVRVLITKPSVAGFGMNWQHCARVAYVGMSYSYEQFYQSVRRCWRFGQAREVVAHVATTDAEAPIVAAVERKLRDHEEMKREMTQWNFAAVKQERALRDGHVPRMTGSLPAWLRP